MPASFRQRERILCFGARVHLHHHCRDNCSLPPYTTSFHRKAGHCSYFVLTFEEVAGMFDAKGVDWKDIPEGEPLFRASADGRGFAVSGGVAEAVVHVVKRIDPDRGVKVMNAEGLQNCKKMLQMAKIGKYNGYLLEGMACPGGCVAGAGTIQTVKKAAAALEKMKKEASFAESYDSEYKTRLESLEKFDVE